VGRSLKVITLQSAGDGWTEALSDNFLKIKISGRHEANQWMKVEIEGVGDENLMAVAMEQTTLAV
jgi:tRNA A37 methylthiotransferase MiaB